MLHTAQSASALLHHVHLSLSLSPPSRYLAANGAIMRTAILGVLEFNRMF